MKLMILIFAIILTALAVCQITEANGGTASTQFRVGCSNCGPNIRNVGSSLSSSWRWSDSQGRRIRSSSNRNYPFTTKSPTHDQSYSESRSSTTEGDQSSVSDQFPWPKGYIGSISEEAPALDKATEISSLRSLASRGSAASRRGSLNQLKALSKNDRSIFDHSEDDIQSPQRILTDLGLTSRQQNPPQYPGSMYNNMGLPSPPYSGPNSSPAYPEGLNQRPSLYDADLARPYPAQKTGSVTMPFPSRTSSESRFPQYGSVIDPYLIQSGSLPYSERSGSRESLQAGLPDSSDKHQDLPDMPNPKLPKTSTSSNLDQISTSYETNKESDEAQHFGQSEGDHQDHDLVIEQLLRKPEGSSSFSKHPESSPYSKHLKNLLKHKQPGSPYAPYLQSNGQMNPLNSKQRIQITTSTDHPIQQPEILQNTQQSFEITEDNSDS